MRVRTGASVGAMGNETRGVNIVRLSLLYCPSKCLIQRKETKDETRMELSNGYCLPSLIACPMSLVDLIRRTESVLQQLNLGVQAWSQLVPLDGYSWSLGYAKIEKRWCLALRKCSGQNSKRLPLEAVEELPLNRATRELKTKAMLKLPGLLRELERQASGQVHAIENTITLTVGIVDLMQESKTQGGLRTMGNELRSGAPR